jgi:pimeloyl-ACP methyl ester carboxylesterase
MPRPLLLVHGYSADAKAFHPVKEKITAFLEAKKVPVLDINICNYISLNNEITIKDIAEGFDRAISVRAGLNNGEEFDAVVHSTGMLVVRSWLVNYGGALKDNKRLKRLKHLIGVAPATWGSPQAHKGRTWLGALVKGNKQPGPDFLNAGDRVLDGLELGSQFTWDLACEDLVGEEPYYGGGKDTPYAAVFIGNEPYEGLASVANDPGTDGTVRWAGCALNTRKVTVDLTRSGPPDGRVRISPWASDRLDVPIIAVEGRNHASLISDPDPGMIERILSFLDVNDKDAFDGWLQDAMQYGSAALSKMKINPGAHAAGLAAEAEKFFGHMVGHNAPMDMDGWQQFVVHAVDEWGDGVSDYVLDVLKQENGEWKRFDEMFADVHAYAADPSFRCFHIRLPKGISTAGRPIRIRINASTGTELMAYRAYSTGVQELGATLQPIELDATKIGPEGKETLFYPFTTTMIEIILNRDPLPFDKESRILGFENA